MSSSPYATGKYTAAPLRPQPRDDAERRWLADQPLAGVSLSEDRSTVAADARRLLIF